MGLVLPPVAIVLFWLGADLGYSLLMKHRSARWEAGIERDPDGVRRGCREYNPLAEQGFACRVMRLPHFATPMHDYRRTRAALWRESVQSELRELRRHHARVVVVAHSLGAAVAVDALADDPAADAVVLLAPLLEVSNRRSPLLSPRAWHWLFDHTLLFTDRVSLPFPPDVRDREALSLLKTDQLVPRVVYRDLMRLIERNRDRARECRVPLFLALGEFDRVVDNQAALRFYHAWAGGPKRLRLMTGAGHVLPMDHGWRSLTEDIVKFLQDLAQAPPSPEPPRALDADAPGEPTRR
jgi:esterase/lipase